MSAALPDETLDILFVARSLDRGGAELQLTRLAAGLRARGWRVGVATFYPGGVHAPTLETAGVRLIHLEKRGTFHLVGPAKRLRALVVRHRVRVVYSFLTDVNVFSALALLGRPSPPLVWGIRAGFMNLRAYGRVARVSFAASRLLARRPQLLIANSAAGAAYHVAHGYPVARMHVVANGFDTDRFRPMPELGLQLRRELGIPVDAEVVGIIARIDAIKDHATLLRAFARLRTRRPRARLLVVGGGAPDFVATVRALATSLGLDDVVHWAGERGDPLPGFNASDVTVLSSLGEGFPNVVGESLACGVPCVVTDVGDARVLVEDPRLVVPPADPDALADALALALDHRAALAVGLRERIIARFGIPAMVERTEALLAPYLGSAASSSS